MKKIILSTICAIIMVFSGINFVLASEDVIAVPTTSTVMVDGKSVAFDAYSIDGNNYFKLRDVAYTINGTTAQFSVTWDKSTDVIALVKGEAYVTMGDEMKKGEGISKTAFLNKSGILLDGKRVSLTSYTINDTNYFKLRDLGQNLNFSVDWNEKSDVITIITKIDPIPESDITPTPNPTSKPSSDTLSDTGKKTVVTVDQNGEIIFSTQDASTPTPELKKLEVAEDEDTEIANVPYQIQLDVADDKPSWMQLASEVLIIHTHTYEEGEFLLKIFEIPEYIYDEMEEKGWNLKQQREFVLNMGNYPINIKDAWSMVKDGKNKDEIIQESFVLQEQRGKLLDQYINGEITIDQYIKQYPMLLEKKTAKAVRIEARDSLAMAMQNLVDWVGLTADEIKFCRANNMTNLNKIATAKNFSKKFKTDFNKVVLTELDSKNWDEVESKLTGKSYDEVKAKNDALRSAGTR